MSEAYSKRCEKCGGTGKKLEKGQIATCKTCNGMGVIKVGVKL